MFSFDFRAMNLSSFNRELLNDRLDEYNKSLQRALEQHRLLTNKLELLKTRYQRSVDQGDLLQVCNG